LAVGLGSKLITKQILQEKNYELLSANTLEALRIIQEIKG